MATAQRKYRGKYPNQVNGYSATTTKGVYLLYTKAGHTFYVAVASMRAAGYTTSMDQVMGMDIRQLDFAYASMAGAAQVQAAAVAATKAAAQAQPA